MSLFRFKQGFVYGLNAVVVLFQDDEIVVHDAVEQAIGEKGGVFTEDAARVFAHLAAQLAEQPQRFCWNDNTKSLPIIRYTWSEFSLPAAV